MLRTRSWALGLAALAVVASSACATPGRSPFFSRGKDKTQVTVRNEHWEALTVYLERDGSLFRLGLVEGNAQAILRVADAYLASHRPVRLVAMETGRTPHVWSEHFELSRGQSAYWTTGPSDHTTAVVIILE